MKTLRVGLLAIVAAGLVAVMAFSKGSDNSNLPVTNSRGSNIQSTNVTNTPVTTPKESTYKFVKLNMTARSDMNRVQEDRSSVQTLEQKVKADCKGNSKAAAIMDKKDLAKAQADLRRDEAYLQADKKELIRSHDLTISTDKDLLNADQKQLAESRKKLNHDIDRGNTSLIESDALLVKENCNMVCRGETRLAVAKSNMNADMLALKKDLKNSSETETAYASR